MSEPLESWPTSHGDTVEVVSSFRGYEATQFRWRVRAANGEIVAQGSESYVRKASAVESAERHHPRLPDIEPAYPTHPAAES